MWGIRKHHLEVAIKIISNIFQQKNHVLLRNTTCFYVKSLFFNRVSGMPPGKKWLGYEGMCIGHQETNSFDTRKNHWRNFPLFSICIFIQKEILTPEKHLKRPTLGQKGSAKMRWRRAARVNQPRATKHSRRQKEIDQKSAVTLWKTEGKHVSKNFETS